MKAIILNSGQGKRMGDLVRDIPKCLVELGTGETILYRQVEALRNAGINEVVLTTGPFAEKIEHYLQTHFPQLNFIFIPNPRYQETNNIYSMHLLADRVEDDVLIMHGDLVFDYKLLKEFLDSDLEDAVLVHPEMELPVKDFKGYIQNGLVRQIGVDLLGQDCFFLMPMYRLQKKSFRKWLEAINEFIGEGKENAYAEEALNEVLNEVSLYPFYYRNEICFEIDDLQDLAKVNELLT